MLESVLESVLESMPVSMSVSLVRIDRAATAKTRWSL